MHLAWRLIERYLHFLNGAVGRTLKLKYPYIGLQSRCIMGYVQMVWLSHPLCNIKTKPMGVVMKMFSGLIGTKYTNFFSERHPKSSPCGVQITIGVLGIGVSQFMVSYTYSSLNLSFLLNRGSNLLHAV